MYQYRQVSFYNLRVLAQEKANLASVSQVIQVPKPAVLLIGSGIAINFSSTEYLREQLIVSYLENEKFPS